MGDRETGDGVLPGFHLPKKEGEKRGRKIGGRELGIDVLGFSSLLIIIYSNIVKVNEVFYE